MSEDVTNSNSNDVEAESLEDRWSADNMSGTRVYRTYAEFLQAKREEEQRK